MAERPERPEPAEAPQPLTDVTEWGLVGDIRWAIRNGRTRFEADDCEVSFGQHNSVVTFRDRESKEVLYQLHMRGEGSDAEFSVSQGGVGERKPLDEKSAQFIRGYFAEALKPAEPPMSVELMNDVELRESIMQSVRTLLGGRTHALARSERIDGEDYFHLFALEGDRVGVSYEPIALDELSMVRREDIVISTDEARSSLETVPEEEDPVELSIDDETRRTMVAIEMGFADRDVSRQELQTLLIRLANAEIVGRSEL